MDVWRVPLNGLVSGHAQHCFRQRHYHSQNGQSVLVARRAWLSRAHETLAQRQPSLQVGKHLSKRCVGLQPLKRFTHLSGIHHRVNLCRCVKGNVNCVQLQPRRWVAECKKRVIRWTSTAELALKSQKQCALSIHDRTPLTLLHCGKLISDISSTGALHKSACRKTLPRHSIVTVEFLSVNKSDRVKQYCRARALKAKSSIPHGLPLLQWKVLLSY